jgi:pumilio family protein 6
MGKAHIAQFTASTRKFAEDADQAKVYWNTLRSGNLDAEKRVELVDKIFECIKSKAFAVSMRHDVSRVLQACFRFGSKAQRTTLTGELEGHFLELSKSQYGHFLTIAALRYGSVKDRKLVLKELSGHWGKLCLHSMGAHVLESAFKDRKVTSPREAASLLHEIYDTEFKYVMSGQCRQPVCVCVGPSCAVCWCGALALSLGVCQMCLV